AASLERKRLSSRGVPRLFRFAGDRELSLACGLMRGRAVAVRRSTNQLSVTAAIGGEFHPDEFAHAAFFHGHAVKNVGLGDGALVVGDDDELTLRHETV